jgi:hypothetical protein
MINVKKFIDKVALAETRNSVQVVLPLIEAKQLRDEIMKIMLDQREQTVVDNNIQVVMRGERW